MSSDAETFFASAFADIPVLAILRGYAPQRAVELAHRAWDLGLEQVEVPIQSPDAVPALRAVIAAGAERDRSVGAGTVIAVEQVHLAAEAGAGFTVAPGTDPEVLAASAAIGLPHLPGVSSPSDVQIALKHGSTWVKAFPAEVLGPAWVRAVRAPFPQVNIVATGGVGADNAAQYLASGAAAVAIGSALADPAQLERVLAVVTSAR